MFRLSLAAVVIAGFLIGAVACQAPVIPPNPKVEVQDQDVQGNVVAIPEVVIDKSGWLVLRPATPEGEPDTSADLIRLGLKPGKYVDIKVPIIVVGERVIFVMLHYDNPGDGRFTFTPGKDEDPPVKVGGQVVARPFIARGVPPAVEVEDQDIVDKNLVISRLAIDKPGWLVLRPATPEGEPEASTDIVRMYLAVPGEYTDVNMSVADITGELTLFAMLHYDDPADEEYTFSPDKAEDPPVKVNGNIIMKAFRVRG